MKELATTRFKTGTSIRHGKIYGIITGSWGRSYTFVWHNGIKIRHNLGHLESFKPITLETFRKYIKKSGYNSLLKYLK